MDFELIIESLPDLLLGAAVTFKLVGLAMILGLVLAVPLALARISKRIWLRGPAYAYIFFFRGTPLLVQIFIVYYGLSQFSEVRESFLWPVLSQAYWCSVIAFTLNTAAYTGEILRGAVQAVPHGQIEAGLSVGMSRLLLLRRIIGPQAARLALPAYSNEFIILMKASSLASTVTLLEITGMTRNIIAETYKPLELFFLAACLYLFLTFVVTRAFKLVERRLRLDPREAGRRLAGPAVK